MRERRFRGRSALGLVGLFVLAGCVKQEMVLELSGTVLYEKPQIDGVSHTLKDSRLQGGTAVVTITMSGDPGLTASFDISPDIVNRQPMEEIEDGSYMGEFSFPPEFVGGPLTIIGRLGDEEAGEVIFRDPTPLTISLVDRRR